MFPGVGKTPAYALFLCQYTTPAGKRPPTKPASSARFLDGEKRRKYNLSIRHIEEAAMEYLILGLLLLAPMTGYELQRFIKQNLALICRCV